MQKSIFLKIMVLVIVTWTIGIGVFAQSKHINSEDSAQVTTNFDADDLAKIGIKLDDPIETAKLNSDEILKKVKEQFAIASREAKEIKIEYKLMTQPNFTAFSEEALNKNPELKAKGRIDKLPVYIVTFSGLEYNGFGGEPGGVQPPPFHECNVVVDAETGANIMSFATK
jgi:hypothetical protein